jgi:hypothetical protein
LLLILAGAVALSGAAIYNGYPFFYFDTHGYYTGGQKAVSAILSLACDFGLGCAAPATDAAIHGPDRAAAATAGNAQSGTISTGRSPFYGVFVYLAAEFASIWLIVVAQALAVSWLLYLACRHLLAERSSPGFLAVIAVVAALTPAPFFVGYLMPDVFAGLYLLAAALMIALYDRLTWRELLAVWVLLVCSMLFHRSHVLTLAMLSLVALFIPMLARSSLRGIAPALVLIGAAVGIGGIGFVALDAAVTKLTGRRATPPPFLLARVIEDGPGTRYLRAACPEERYVVCRFVDRMPISEHDFLWSKEPGVGVWYVVSPEDRIQIAKEQYTIVLRSIRHDPSAQIQAVARNFGQQLIDFGLGDFAVGDDLRRSMAESFGGEQADAFSRSRVARGDIELNTLSALYYLIVCGAIVVLSLRFRALQPDIRIVIVIVGAGLALNAFVTGCISTPLPRFQARMIWLVPALAAIVEFRRLTRHHEAVVDRSQRDSGAWSRFRSARRSRGAGACTGARSASP